MFFMERTICWVTIHKFVKRGDSDAGSGPTLASQNLDEATFSGRIAPGNAPAQLGWVSNNQTKYKQNQNKNNGLKKKMRLEMDYSANGPKDPNFPSIFIDNFHDRLLCVPFFYIDPSPCHFCIF